MSTEAKTPLQAADLFKIIGDNGINVDFEGMIAETKKLQAEELIALDELNEVMGFEDLRKKFPADFKPAKKSETVNWFNPRSRKHLGAWFTNRGEELPHSFAEATLELRLPPDEFEHVMRARRLRKYWGDLGTLRNHMGPDGKIHVKWVEAKTFRWYAGSPNIQTMAKICREFLVPDPGNKFWVVDWEQQELRLLAFISGEPFLTKMFVEGEDPHIGAYTAVTGQLGSDDPLKFKLQRDVGKMLNYALIYGLEAQGLGSRLKIPNEKAKALIEKYFAAMPILAEWRYNQQKLVKEQGYVETLGGRRIPVELEVGRRDAEAQLARKAVNYKIQGSAAEQLVNAMRDLNEMGLLVHIRATIHDAFLVETSTDTETAAHHVSNVMRNSAIEGLETPVEIKGPAATWMQAMDYVEDDMSGGDT